MSTIRDINSISVWSRARHCGIGAVWAKMSPSSSLPGSFWRTSLFCGCKEFVISPCSESLNRLKFGENAKCREPCSSPTQTKWPSYSRSLDTSTNNRYRGFNSLNSTCLWGGDRSSWTKSCQNKERFQYFLAEGNQKTMLKMQKPMKLSLEKIRGVNRKLKLQSETFKIPGLKNTNGWSTINRRVCSVHVASNLVNPILSPVVA